jgi:predicted nucleic acid-binding protein
MALYAAVLDANVLVPSALTDTLLRLAEHGFYRPVWSARILDEVRETVISIRPGGEAGINRRLDAMDSSFEDASVTGWEPVCAGLDLPDEDDRHVLAAAIAGRADCIVTANLKDFPASVLDAHGVEARHPDEFLLDQLALYPRRALDLLEEQASAMKRPPTDLAGLLFSLERAGVPLFVEEARRQLYA